MAEGHAVARQNGAPENRIVRFLSGQKGYILVPQITRTSNGTLVPIGASHATARLAFRNDGKPLETMPGYGLIALTAHVAGNYLTTAAQRNSPLLRGAFKNGTFAGFPFQGFTAPGAFKHQYIDPETSQQRTIVLMLQTDGSVRSSVDGSTLTSSGDAVAGNPSASPQVLTWTAAADGRTLIVEFSVYQFLRYAFRLNIDYAGSPQVIKSKINDATPYGARTSTETVSNSVSGISSDWSASGSTVTAIPTSAVFPLTYGLDADGATVSINATQSREEGGLTFTFSESGQSSPSHYQRVENRVQDQFHKVTLQLPGGGASREFLLNRVAFTQQINFERSGSSSYSVSYTEHRDVVQASLGIIYADPSVPILFYEYIRTDAALDVDGGWSAADGAIRPVDPPGSASAITVREVGVLCGNAHRILSTESLASSVLNAPTAGFFTFGYPHYINIGQINVGMVEFSFEQASARTSFTIGPTVTNVSALSATYPFIKQLKYTSDLLPIAGTALNRTNSNSSPLWHVRDVNDLISPYQNNPRFWVAVKNVDDWIFGVTRRRSLSDAVINTFDIYAGTLGEAALKQRIVDYLVKALQAATTPLPDVIADFQAGNIAPYEIRLSGNVTRLAMR